MSETRYATPAGLAEAIERVIRGHNGIGEGRIRVIDAGRAHVVGDTREELERRNVPYDDGICSIKFKRTEFGSNYALDLTLTVHESEVEGTFKLTPAGPDAIGANQATDPAALGERVSDALSEFVEEYDPIFTFKEVSAQSMANVGHYTDFVFEYSIDAADL